MDKKNIIDSIFGSLDSLRTYVSGIDLRGDVSQYEASASLALMHIEHLLPGFPDLILNQKGTEEYELLLTALANKLQAHSLVFIAVQTRQSGGEDMYKYEIEMMRRSVTENYYYALASLFDVLSTSTKYRSAWAKTHYAKRVEQVEIKSCLDFDAIYPIDQSHIFFFRSLSLQAEELLSMRHLFDTLSSKEDKDPSREDYKTHTQRLRLALAKRVVASALERFDPIELPAVLRNYFDEQHLSRSDSQSKEYIARLRKEAEGLSSAVAVALSETRTTIGDSCYTDEDKILLIP